MHSLTLREALHRGGSDATSLDELAVNLLAAMPGSGDRALYQYARLLCTYLEAFSNEILKPGFYKAGLTHLF